MSVIIVSKCLLGYNCRYDGQNCLSEKVCKFCEGHTVIEICPEVDGGLPTPRTPSERVGCKVLMKDGRDVTSEYNIGARKALEEAIAQKADFAILKTKSPSCGKGLIYDGSFTGNKIPGNGVTAELLLANGIPVYTEEELDFIDLD